MASRWNDFDDDLHFKSQPSSKYDDFEEQNELGYKSEPKTNNSSSNGSSRFVSENSSSSKSGISIKLKSEISVPEENDFDPRAGEPAGTSSKKDGGGDFADFQSAFGVGATTTTGGAGTTTTTTNSSTVLSSHDLFSSASPEPTSSSSGGGGGGMDLLGLEITAPISAQSVIGSNISFDGFTPQPAGGGFQSFQGFTNATTQPTSLPFQQIPSFQSNLPQQQQQQPENLLFGNQDILLSSSNVGMLQPQQVNHINNNNVQQGSTGTKKTTLEVYESGL
jgi:hypothetical protein